MYLYEYGDGDGVGGGSLVWSVDLILGTCMTDFEISFGILLRGKYDSKL